jgi:hypothetical protein
VTSETQHRWEGVLSLGDGRLRLGVFLINLLPAHPGECEAISLQGLTHTLGDCPPSAWPGIITVLHTAIFRAQEERSINFLKSF